ncbi:hypothetical protein Poli38472_001553 [Pythium oligandrum]|uniref:ELMO domain-containing protein n=1 Tax=Pythium oligandrum TaxID=41045 RepID=A0A8K1CT32_PYTOL|nr:hypothetical protein Poli38472_001553 [Pythium oligandrum]|eukprot:TMW69397.1 hypothetical protein Poli38472_001553 [Pythium oligandrum]
MESTNERGALVWVGIFDLETTRLLEEVVMDAESTMETQLQGLDELLDEAQERGEAEEEHVQETTGASEDMSADDMLEQLDAVTLSVEAEEATLETTEPVHDDAKQEEGDKAETMDAVELVHDNEKEETNALEDVVASPTELAEEAEAVGCPEPEEVIVTTESSVSHEGVEEHGGVEEADEGISVSEPCETVTESYEETKPADDSESPPEDHEETESATSQVVVDQTAGQEEVSDVVAGEDTADKSTIEEEDATVLSVDDGDSSAKAKSEEVAADPELEAPTTENTVIEAEEEEVVPPSEKETTDDAWVTVPLAVEEDTAPLPPPAPVPTQTTPMVSGWLNPTSTDDTQADSDSESDSDDEGNDAPPPPLRLGELPTYAEDDADELEVDPAVVEEIRAARVSAPEPSKLNEPVEEKQNALLAALNAAAGDVPFTDEVRVAVAVEDKTTESTASAFGIGYQSLHKKRKDSGIVKDPTVTVRNTMFQDLEREMTLTTDLSFSVKGRGGKMDAVTEEANAPEDDEFGEIPDGEASPTRVNAILAKQQSAEERDAQAQNELLQAMREATGEERQRIQAETVIPTMPSVTSEENPDDPLTIKELHSIYKRGLGDQEVRMLEEDDEVKTEDKALDPAPTTASPMSVMGRILSKPTVFAEAINEEDEQGGDKDEEDDDEDDDSAHTVDSERLMLIDNGTDGETTTGPEDHDDRSASAEWKEIQLLRKVSATQIQEPSPASGAGASAAISYDNALHYFMESEQVLEARDRIVVEELAPIKSCLSCLARPRLTFAGAMDERERVFCVAATAFDAQNAVHVGMLQTIHRALQHNNRDVGLMGPHWEQIGFQGNDPSTDLRGCGVLSLLEMVYLVEHHAELARRFHTLSQHPTRHFPMACALINVTLQCLLAVRSGALFRECNKRRSILEAIHGLFVALTTQLMREIAASDADIPLIMKRVLDHGRSHPDRVLQDVVAAQSSSSPSRPSSAAAPDFSEIGLNSIADES